MLVDSTRPALGCPTASNHRHRSGVHLSSSVWHSAGLGPIGDMASGSVMLARSGRCHQCRFHTLQRSNLLIVALTLRFKSDAAIASASLGYRGQLPLQQPDRRMSNVCLISKSSSPPFISDSSCKDSPSFNRCVHSTFRRAVKDTVVSWKALCQPQRNRRFGIIQRDISVDLS